MQQNTALQQQLMNQEQATNTMQYSILPDLSHNTAKFDGLTGAASTKTWLQQLDSTVALHRWTEPIAFETARSNLTGDAKNWFIGHMDVLTDWQTFRKAFVHTFMMEKSMTEKWEEMRK